MALPSDPPVDMVPPDRASLIASIGDTLGHGQAALDSLGSAVHTAVSRPIAAAGKAADSCRDAILAELSRRLSLARTSYDQLTAGVETSLAARIAAAAEIAASLGCPPLTAADLQSAALSQPAGPPEPPAVPAALPRPGQGYSPVPPPPSARGGPQPPPAAPTRPLAPAPSPGVGGGGGPPRVDTTPAEPPTDQPRSAPGGSGGGPNLYQVWRDTAAGKCGVWQMDQTPPPSYGLNIGCNMPLTTALAVSVACPQAPLSGPYAPCQATPPPPPPEPPPEPPGDWYCLGLDNGEHVTMQFPGSYAAGLIGGTIGGGGGPVITSASGPYATQAEAAAAFGCGGGVPGPEQPPGPPPEPPPTEPPPPVKPPPPPAVKWPRWCDVNVCATINSNNDSLQGGSAFNVWEVLGAYDGAGNVDRGSWVWSILTHVPQFLTDAIIRGAERLNAAVNSALGPLATSANQLGLAFTVRAGLDLATKWFGLGLEDALRSVEYWVNYLSPSEIPSVGEADAAYLQGLISRGQWECWVRANNQCLAPHAAVLGTQLRVPSWRDAEQLYRSSGLPKEQRDAWYRREQINEADQPWFTELYTQWPGMQDIITFMVRDVWDATVVEAAGLDDEFQAKYTADASKYGSIAGLTPDLARLYWRAHWRLPATGQVYEMVHRLRPGRVSKDLEFTEADGLKLLGVNDVAPGYRTRLMAIAYRPLSRLDAKRLYYLGVIDQAEVAEILKDEGMAPAAADKVARGIRAERVRRYLGYPEATAYKAGGMTRAEFQAALKAYGLPPEDVREVQDTLDRVAKAKRRAACVKAIGKRYQLADLAPDQATAALTSLGLAGDEASALVAEWQCEVQAKGRQASVGDLCQWADSGLISADEYAVRLARLGYPPADVARIVQTCQAKAAERLAKAQAALDRQQKAQAAREAAKAARDAQRAANAEQRALAEAARTAEQQAKADQRQAARDAAARAKKAASAQKVALQQTELVAEMERVSGLQGDAAREAVANAVLWLTTETEWDRSAAIALIKTALGAARSAKRQDWYAILGDMVGVPPPAWLQPAR